MKNEKIIKKLENHFNFYKTYYTDANCGIDTLSYYAEGGLIHISSIQFSGLKADNNNIYYIEVVSAEDTGNIVIKLEINGIQFLNIASIKKDYIVMEVDDIIKTILTRCFKWLY